MITAFITGVVVAIPTSLITMKLLNSSLFISNTELREANAKISLIINNLDAVSYTHLTLPTTPYV